MTSEVYGVFTDSLNKYPFFIKKIKRIFKTIKFLTEDISYDEILKFTDKGGSILFLGRDGMDANYRATWLKKDHDNPIIIGNRDAIIEFITKNLEGV